jgi:hypothetical protein
MELSFELIRNVVEKRNNLRRFNSKTHVDR